MSAPVRLLHTADWHLGKVLKGLPRIDEQRRVLAELVAIADRERVDAVVVAGDVFESSAPSPDAQELAWRTLLDLADTGAHVVVIAGNHDHGEQFQALRPVFAAAGVAVLGRATRPDAGGVVERVGRHSGAPVRVAALPFVSQRGVVRAAQLLTDDPAAPSDANVYEHRYRLVVDRLASVMHDDAVNVLAAHATVLGARLGGGEREAQTVFGYAISAAAYPATAHYVALGHLHRQQRVAAAAPTWYSGSPIAVDFGEGDDTKAVLVVEATPTTPARVRSVPLTAARPLRSVRGSLAALEAMADGLGDALLRVTVDEAARSGLADEVRRILPNTLEVQVLGRTSAATPAGPTRSGSPGELFRRYCAGEGLEDPAVVALFDALFDEVTTGSEPTGDGA